MLRLPNATAPMVEWALAYAERGWLVLPIHSTDSGGACSCGRQTCTSPAKHPRVERGLWDATTDSETIRTWWERWPDANVAIRTGVESGLVVLDVDPRHGGEETLRAAANGGFPATLTVITGGGGHHYYFAHPGGNERIKNQQPLDGLPGLDRRGDAGYVLAPPSRHASGRRYEWGDPSALVALTLARCPDWLASDAVNGNGGEPRAPVDVAAALAGVPEGERDDTIFRTACKLRYAGVPEETATDLVVLAASRCTPPFPEATAREKVHRAYGKYPEGKGSAADNGGSPAASTSTKKRGRPRSTAGKYFSSSASFVPALLADDIQAEHTFVASPIANETGKADLLFVYEQGVYRPIGARVVRAVGAQLLGRHARDSRLTETLELIKTRTAEDWDHLNSLGLDLINVRNGMLVWKTGDLLPHDPRYLSTLQLPVTWGDPVEEARLLDFIRSVLPPDTMKLFFEWVGYCLLPTQRFQKALVLVGPGASGKSTLLELLRRFIGLIHCSSVSLHDLTDNRFAIANLHNKLVNIYADLDSRSLRSSGLFKAIVGGDRVTGERKYGHPFDFYPTARLAFSANKMPRTSDVGSHYYRRLLLVPCDRVVPTGQRNPRLLDELDTPATQTALLRHAVEGLRRLWARGRFEEPESVRRALEQYQLESDAVRRFAFERIELTAGESIPGGELYDAFKQWTETNGLAKPKTPLISSVEFAKQLKEVLNLPDDVNRRSNRGSQWHGLGWRPETDDESV